MAEYKAKFDEQSSLTKWSQVDLRTRFYNGLSDSIKDTLAITDRPIETLTELFESSQIVDTRMRQRTTEKKGQTFHQQGKSQDPSGVVPMEIDASCQQGKQCNQNQQSSGSGKNWASWMKQMAGKCFRCGSSDHTKKAGNHDWEICHHCQKAGHRANVCFDKYMGKEKKAKAAGTQQATFTSSGQGEQAASTSTPTPAPSSSQSELVKLLMEQQKVLSEQLEALKLSF